MSALIWTALAVLTTPVPREQQSATINRMQRLVQNALVTDREVINDAQGGSDVMRAGTAAAAAATSAEQSLPVDPGPGDQTAAQPPQEDIVVTGRDLAEATDPLQVVNEASFGATQAVDRAIVGPVAMAYKKVAPKPFRSGVHNLLYNLREPVVFVNFVLQHKIGKAGETVARFALNTTIGVAGLFDMAKRKPFHLPRRGNGFADTLGFYGVPNGPFLFLPLVGPTTVRDLLGGAVDRLVLPVAFGSRITKPEVSIPLGVLGVLDHRSEFDETLHALHDDVPSPYANTRAFYLGRRQAEIDHLRGHASGSSSPMSEAPKVPAETKDHKINPRAVPER